MASSYCILEVLATRTYGGRSRNGVHSLAASTYHRKQLSRVYPKGPRVDSSNYDPVPIWNCGSQLLAMNYQTPDRPMQLYQGRFLTNGRSVQCGSRNNFKWFLFIYFFYFYFYFFYVCTIVMFILYYFFFFLSYVFIFVLMVSLIVSVSRCVFCIIIIIIDYLCFFFFW